MSNDSVAVYIGTFDPLTLGHLDMIRRASQIFTSLIVGVGENSSKTPFFSASERVSMLEKSCKDLKNVLVKKAKGLAVDFAKQEGASILVRGLRTEADFNYEMQMSLMNKTLHKELETVFIPTRQELCHISSTLIKEIASLGGDVKGFVPDHVAAKIKENLA